MSFMITTDGNTRQRHSLGCGCRCPDPEVTMADSDMVPSDLNALAVQIRTEVDAAEADFRSAVAHAIRAGELLIEAKSQVGHGQWLPWLAANCSVKEREAQNYMRLARNRNAVADLPTIRQAVAALTTPEPEPEPERLVRNIKEAPRDVQNTVIREMLRQRQESRPPPSRIPDKLADLSTYHGIDKELAKAALALDRALRIVREAEQPIRNPEFLIEDVGHVRAALDLLLAALGGDTGIDWDRELSRLHERYD